MASKGDDDYYKINSLCITKMFIAQNAAVKMCQCMMMAFASAMAAGISGMKLLKISKVWQHSLNTSARAVDTQ